MSTTARLRLVVLVVALGAAGMLGRAAAPQQSAAAPPTTAPLAAKIPVDPQIAVGRLSNGLQYYIRSNKEPQNRAALRLVVNAGSVLEDDDQRGLAHFVEHMAFNGTAHFPKSDIIDFMQSLGMRFGQDVNAYTTTDETIYMLDVPTDKPAVLDRAMLALEDWAHNVTFDPTEVEKERGVITEEWRLRRGAGARLQDKEFPTLLKGSRYADRITIGLMDVVAHAPVSRIKAFYTDWYRPDLMAVVAVGDFDRAAVESMVKAHFGSIPEPSRPKPRPTITVPDHNGTLYSLTTDKEVSATDVTVYNVTPARDQTTIGAYRTQVVEGLYAGMLSARLGEMAQKPDAPFIRASVGRESIVRTTDATVLDAVVTPTGIDRGLAALFAETARVARFGFTDSEFSRQKANILRNLEEAVAEKDKEPSSDLAAEFARNFLTKEPIPGIVYEDALYQRFLPEITLAEINALAKTWSPDRDRVVTVSAPDTAGFVMPAERALAADMVMPPGADLTPYADTAAAQALVDRPPTPGTIVKSSTNDAYGLTEWTLSNGVTVLLKPTDFKEDEILMQASSLGGTSLAPDADFTAARTAAQVVGAGGLGQFNLVDLRKALAGKNASVGASIGETDESVSGASSVRDLETLFQLTYLTFTEPRADADIFKVLTTNLKTQLANQSASPDFAVNSALVSALTQDHLRGKPMTAALVDEMNLDKSFAFYKARFADASGFTFVFVGSFTLDQMRPLVERYLASLPATHAHESWKDVGMRPPTTVVTRQVAKGIDPKSETLIVFSGPFEYDQKHRAAIRAMSMVLENRLREVLREDLSGTYSQSASAGYSKLPIAQYRVTVAYGSSPDRADALATRTLQEIEKLKAEGPTAQEVQNTKETLLRDYETSSRENAFYLREIAVRHEYGEDLKDLFGLADIYGGIDAAAIQGAAKQYLDPGRYVKVILVPEKE